MLRIAALCGLLLLTAGCVVPSLQPLYTPETQVFEPALIGAWTDSEGGTQYTFIDAGDQVYGLVMNDNNKNESRFMCQLVKLDGKLYIDLYPGDLDALYTAYAPWHLLPAHSIYRIDRLEPTLQISTINPEWLRGYADTHPGAIGLSSIAVTEGDNIPVLTATTAELQAFIIQHGGDEDAFYGAVELVKK